MEELLNLGFDIDKIKKIKGKKQGYFMYVCYTIMQKYQNNNEILNEIAQKLNIKISEIVANAQKFIKVNDFTNEIGFDLNEVCNFKKAGKDFQYFCVAVLKKFSNNSNALNSIAEILDIRVDDISHYAKKHKDESASNYNDPYRAMIKRDEYIKNGYGKPFEEIMSKIINSNNQDELNAYLFENLQLIRDKRFITSYVINMYPRESKKMFELINTKLKAFSLFLQKKKEKAIEEKKRKKQEDINYKSHIYKQEIMKDNISRGFYDFCDRNKIDRKEFTACIEIWKQEKEGNRTVYDILSEKLNINRKKYFEQFNNLIDKILPLITQYIKVGNTVRKFDIIDCYTYFGNDLEEVLPTIIENYSQYSYEKEENKEITTQLAYLKKFIREISSNYTNLESKDYHYSSVSLEKEFIEAELKNETVVNQDKLVDGKIIKEPYKVSALEKEEIFDIMSAYRIPINTKNYNFMLKHLNNGKIEIITRDNVDYLIKENSKEGKTR